MSKSLEKDLFHRGVQAIHNQKVASHQDLLGCRYRGPNGTKCAVGHLIADEHYNSSFEGKIVVSSREIIKAIEKSIGAKLNSHHIKVLKFLQKAHDNAALKEPKYFLYNFHDYAAKYAEELGLDYQIDE